MSPMRENSPKGPGLSTWIFLTVALALFAVAAPDATRAGFDEGIAAFDRGGYAKALPEFRAAAEAGNAGAQYYLGRMYFLSDGVKADYKRAAEYFRQAADQGYVNAQFYLGVMHYLGEGVTKDYAEALKWYGKAAARGDSVSQYYLAVMHAAGSGVPRDYVQAFFWFELSARAGNPTAVRFRDIISDRMTDADIAKARKLADGWKPLAK